MKGKYSKEKAGWLEMQAGGNLFKLLDNNIIFIEAHGEQTPEIARQSKKICLDLIGKFNDNCSYLINLNDAGKSSPEARKIWKELSEHDRILKVAIYGINPVAKVLASFVMDITKNSNMHFFNSFEKAISWINNDNRK